MAVERKCEWCGKKFHVKPSVAKKGGGRFCSVACRGKWCSQNMRGDTAPNRKEKVKKICEQCGKELEVIPSLVDRKRFCSRTCRSQWMSENMSGKNSPLWKQMETTCLYCGKTFFAPPNVLDNGKGKFCNRECFGKWESKNVRGSKAPRWAGGKVKKLCLQCGKIFETWPYKIRAGEGKFCSRTCRSQWASENTSGEDSWHWERVTVQCKQCGKDFSVEPALLTKDRGQFCSRKCKDLWWSENSRGENHWNWRDGKSLEPYGDEWNKALREAVRKRDDYTCAISGEVWQMGQDKFHVHHINYCKADNRSENLIILSPSCHMKTNYNRRHWQVLLTHITKGAEMCANAFVDGI